MHGKAKHAVIGHAQHWIALLRLGLYMKYMYSMSLRGLPSLFMYASCKNAHAQCDTRIVSGVLGMWLLHTLASLHNVNLLSQGY